jgi:hypothetical protein
VFPAQDVAPEHTGKGSAKGQAKSSVVDTYRHAVYGSPEGSVRNRESILSVYLLPCLNDSGEEDCGANVCACELFLNEWSAGVDYKHGRMTHVT